MRELRRSLSAWDSDHWVFNSISLQHCSLPAAERRISSLNVREVTTIDTTKTFRNFKIDKLCASCFCPVVFISSWRATRISRNTCIGSLVIVRWIGLSSASCYLVRFLLIESYLHECQCYETRMLHIKKQGRKIQDVGTRPATYRIFSGIHTYIVYYPLFIT